MDNNFTNKVSSLLFSGTLLRFSLPHVVMENKYVVRLRPQLLALSCDSRTLSIIDINGVLTLFDLEARPQGPKVIMR